MAFFDVNPDWKDVLEDSAGTGGMPNNPLSFPGTVIFIKYDTLKFTNEKLKNAVCNAL